MLGHERERPAPKDRASTRQDATLGQIAPNILHSGPDNYGDDVRATYGYRLLPPGWATGGPSGPGPSASRSCWQHALQCAPQRTAMWRHDRSQSRAQ